MQSTNNAISDDYDNSKTSVNTQSCDDNSSNNIESTCQV